MKNSVKNPNGLVCNTNKINNAREIAKFNDNSHIYDFCRYPYICEVRLLFPKAFVPNIQ